MRIIRLCLILGLILSVSFLKAQSNDNLYSFFIAGHSYGQPGVNNVGLHPPFKKKFEYIKSRSEIKFGVLTGDIVKPSPIAQDWDEVDADIVSLGLPIYFAVGNHDMENRPLFESRYGETYFHFIYQNDLFIVLDPNLDGWNISGAQLEFLENVVDENYQSVANIFVLFHQLLWRESDNIYSDIKPNSFAGRDETINFWTVIEPLFHELPNQVVFCCGDVGAASWSSDFMYDSYDNISFIASGMGENDGDNFVVINVNLNKTINYDLICLGNSMLNCFGELTDYQMSQEKESFVKIYPNPVSSFVTIEFGTKLETIIQLFDINGRLILEQQNNGHFKQNIDLTFLSKGLYIIKVVNELHPITTKLVVQ
ncbi:MAG: T9SS type A sorting domain-containing protein [Bacteroidota bacterium]|nr:T9SS type A sorting domain-containing protein [Bacteroidota bacterium]